MKWKTLLTKQQLKHLRWSRDGAEPTLQAFRELREFQDNERVRRAKIHLYAPLCHDCDEIAAVLKKHGKL